VRIEVVEVSSGYFGGAVTVTGLLTGSDILAALAAAVPGEVLLLPDVLLREGSEMLLDDVTCEELERQLGVRVEVVPAEPWGILDILETLALERGERE
jgi:NifB/MoaA-like Fe-S oxidoreductase